MFRLVNLTIKDSGYYLCNGQNSLGPQRDYVYLYVEPKKIKLDNSNKFEPMIEILGNKNVVVYEGSSFEIKCKASNLVDNIEIRHHSQSDRIKSIRKEDNVYILNLENIQLQDKGHYICFGFSDHDGFRDYMYLDVLPKEDDDLVLTNLKIEKDRKPEFVEEEETTQFQTELDLVSTTESLKSEELITEEELLEDWNERPRVEMFGPKRLIVFEGI